MTYKEFASQINIKVDNPPNDCDMSREITIEDCIYLLNSLGRQIRHLQERNRWHTGTPTEDGWYVVAYHKRDCDGSLYWEYGTRYWNDFGAFGDWNADQTIYPVIAWQKIEPYKER